MAVQSVASCAFFFDAEPLGEAGRHALDACALCTKPLTRNSDIFMYKGDTPFCSEECRYEQMHHDAACARQQASASRRSQLSRHEAAVAVAAAAAAPAAAAPVSRKADVSVLS